MASGSYSGSSANMEFSVAIALASTISCSSSALDPVASADGDPLPTRMLATRFMRLARARDFGDRWSLVSSCVGGMLRAEDDEKLHRATNARATA